MQNDLIELLSIIFVIKYPEYKIIKRLASRSGEFNYKVQQRFKILGVSFWSDPYFNEHVSYTYRKALEEVLYLLKKDYTDLKYVNSEDFKKNQKWIPADNSVYGLGQIETVETLLNLLKQRQLKGE